MLWLRCGGRSLVPGLAVITRLRLGVLHSNRMLCLQVLLLCLLLLLLRLCGLLLGLSLSHRSSLLRISPLLVRHLLLLLLQLL